MFVYYQLVIKHLQSINTIS